MYITKDDPLMITCMKLALSKGWAWGEGASVHVMDPREWDEQTGYDFRVFEVEPDKDDNRQLVLWRAPFDCVIDAKNGKYVPDLTDPATLGCLLAAVHQLTDKSMPWPETDDDILRLVEIMVKADKPVVLPSNMHQGAGRQIRFARKQNPGQKGPPTNEELGSALGKVVSANIKSTPDPNEDWDEVFDKIRERDWSPETAPANKVPSWKEQLRARRAQRLKDR